MGSNKSNDSFSLGLGTRGMSSDTMIWMLLMIQISFSLDVDSKLYAPFQFKGFSLAVHVTSLGNWQLDVEFNFNS